MTGYCHGKDETEVLGFYLSLKDRCIDVWIRQSMGTESHVTGGAVLEQE